MRPDSCPGKNPGRDVPPGLLFSVFTIFVMAGSVINCGGGGGTEPPPPPTPGTTATPTFWPVAGSYSPTQLVTISDSTAGATIYYTTDGTTPTQSSSVYAAPVSVAANTTLKALAAATGANPSGVAIADYAILSGAAGADVAAVLTTPDRTRKMDPQAGFTFTVGTGNTNVIVVDESQAYQVIEGFGASFTDSAAYLLNQVASTTNRDAVMNNLFTRTGQGIGLSFIRNPMGSTDLARSLYSYDDGAADLTLANFSIAHDADVMPLTKQAKTLNSNLKIMANPWSPPGWMKQQGSMIGGNLKTDAATRTAFANYFVKYIKAYADQSVPIDYISLQNEPLLDTVNSGYPGMYMDAATQTTVLRDYVLPALTTAKVDVTFPDTKVLVWDHNWDNSSFPNTVLSDTTVKNSPQVAGVAWHGYGGTPGVMTTLQNGFPTKGQYMTEHSGGTWVGDQVKSDFDEIIHVMRNWAKAYVKWSLVLDQNMGPHYGGCGTCTPLVTVNSGSGAITYDIEYYTMGQFSKYILPGATRIYSNNAPGLVSAAFKNPDNSKALVVYNETTAARSFQVQWGTQVFAYTMPSQTGATFTWSGTQSGSYTLDAKKQIQASSYSGAMGLQTETTSDADLGYDLGFADNGDVAFFKNVDFGAGGLTNVKIRSAFAGSTLYGTAGTVQFHLDSATGPLIGTATIRITSTSVDAYGNFTNYQAWETQIATLTDAASATGVHDLYLVYTGSGNLNWFQFE